MPTLYEAPQKKREPAMPPRRVEKNPPQTMRPLTAFALEPDGVRFETQQDEETVELFLRQHPIVNVPWIIGSIILLIAPPVLFPLLLTLKPAIFVIPSGYIICATLFWYLATFGFILANFLYWFFNIYIVTNERLVDIDFYYLLYKRFSQAELVKIQDIAFTTGGLLATALDYGNVSIETEGEAPNLLFEKVPHPEKIVETIRTLTEAEKRESL